MDTGASDNFKFKFLSSPIQQEFGIPIIEFGQLTTISMGTEGSDTQALGETPPLTLQCGSCCTHKTNFTILPLGDYDIVLGRPFQKYTKLVIQDDVCLIPTKRGQQALPRWASLPDSSHTLICISRREMAHTLKQLTRPESAMILIPKPNISLLALHTPGPCEDLDLERHKDPEITACLAQQHAEDAVKDSEGGGTPISSIPRGKISGLDDVLREFADVFPEDLPTEMLFGFMMTVKRRIQGRCCSRIQGGI